MPGRPTIWITVRQGLTTLAVGHFHSHLSFLFSFSLSLEAARYRQKYCLKGPLNPKQPTNQPKGSDDPIRQHNRVSTLDDMMEAEESPSCIPKGTLSRVPTT